MGLKPNVLEGLSLARLIRPERKCRELTRKKEPCANFPMKESDYCYIHSFGKFQRVPFLKNPLFHLFLGLLVGVPGTYYSFRSFYSGATGEQVESVKKGMETIVNELIIVRHSELLRKYPEGYVVFYIDEKNQINLPSNSVFYDRQHYTVNWDEAKISSSDRARIGILIPTIIDLKDGCSLTNVLVGITPKEGVVWPVMSPCKLQITIEVVSVKNEKVICVLGFARNA
jgi:hypothetical protein